MRIKVTAAHIAGGKRCMSCSCAVALAIAEAMPGSSPEVGTAVIALTVRGRPVHVPTPPEVAAFVRRFDDGEGPEPFEFDLDVAWEPRHGRALSA